MRMNMDHVASGHFVLGRDVLCEFDYWPLAVSMPPTKVCPQCNAAIPVAALNIIYCIHVSSRLRRILALSQTCHSTSQNFIIIEQLSMRKSQKWGNGTWLHK